jgi:hypothetical protein
MPFYKASEESEITYPGSIHNAENFDPHGPVAGRNDQSATSQRSVILRF